MKLQLMLDLQDECVVLSLVRGGETELSIGFSRNDEKALRRGCKIAEMALQTIFGPEEAEKMMARLSEKIRLQTFKN